jgi:hypothetical protein
MPLHGAIMVTPWRDLPEICRIGKEFPANPNKTTCSGTGIAAKSSQKFTAR